LKSPRVPIIIIRRSPGCKRRLYCNEAWTRTTRRSFVRSAALAVPGLALSPRFSFAADSDGGPVKKLRILILGGTGFTGAHHVRYALARGHKVTLFNRGRQAREWPARSRN